MIILGSLGCGRSRECDAPVVQSWSLRSLPPSPSGPYSLRVSAATYVIVYVLNIRHKRIDRDIPLRLTAVLSSDCAAEECGLLPNLAPDARSSVTVEFDVPAEPIPFDSQHQAEIAGSREVRDNLVEA